MASVTSRLFDESNLCCQPEFSEFKTWIENSLWTFPFLGFTRASTPRVQNRTVVYSFISALLLHFILSPLNSLSLFVRNQLTIDICVYFWTVSFIHLYAYLHVHITLSWLLLLHRKFWDWEVWVLQLCSSFSRYFGYSGSCEFPYEFKISLSISTKKPMVFW